MRADLKNQGPSKAEAKILEGTARHWWKLWPNARFRLSGDVPRSSLSGCSPPLADIRSHRCAHIFGVSTEIASRAHGLASVDDFQSVSRYRCASCREDVRKAELVIERLTLSNPAGAASSYQAPRVWLGPQGTVTPMHCDYTENLFAQIWGRKLFSLCPPHMAEHLNIYEANPVLHGTHFNPDAPRFPGLPRHARVEGGAVHRRSGRPAVPARGLVPPGALARHLPVVQPLEPSPASGPEVMRHAC